MPPYGEGEAYWDARYTRHPTAFDWFQSYAGIRSIIEAHVPKTADILQVGVGTSRVQEDMVRVGGYKSIMNIDISGVVIEHMRELHKGIPELQYKKLDVKNMHEFQDATFDFVFDKGTLDSILCGDDTEKNAAAMLRECHRVLRHGGVMIDVTYGDPLSRLLYMERVDYDWDTCVYVVTKPDSPQNPGEAPQEGAQVIKGPFEARNVDAMESLASLDLDKVHFVYVMKKLEGLAPGSSAAAAATAARTEASE